MHKLVFTFKIIAGVDDFVNNIPIPGFGNDFLSVKNVFK